ncbi:ABC transporter permease [Dactylosporangium sp. CA-092794]|uniref:ABC transporter permease n=1 Tax=Dactylosporangium sp. CA-092794 TaxID=3239929 RepID=UPI003D8CE568
MTNTAVERPGPRLGKSSSRRAFPTARRLARRLGELVLVLFIASFLTFSTASLLPGDPAVAILGPEHPQSDYVALRHQMGLDKPFLVRYFSWLGHALQGDLGITPIPPGGQVSDRILAALPVSGELAILAILLAVVLSVPMALVSASRPGGRADRVLTATVFGVISVPSFLLGLVIIMVLVNKTGAFPRNGWVRLGDGGLGPNLYHAFLPAFTLALNEAAIYARLLRNDLVTTLREDFILAAKAKGMPRVRVLVREALRPSSLGVVTIAGISLGRLLGGTVIVETLFGLPGLGSLIVKAASDGDVILMQGAVLVIALGYVLVNALVDISYTWLDPRIRRERP